jgi:DNA-binding transcriptional LysR family regulator
MDLRQLEVFAQVATLGSFSRAAEALHLSQPTVSEHIRALEEELGLRLLDRLGRGAAATRAGELLLDYAQRILVLHREARQALASFQGRMSGELVVGASTIPGEYILPALIGRFRDKYPEISMTLLIGDSQDVIDWVAAGRVEIGVAGARPPNRPVEYQELAPDEEVVIVPPTHAWFTRKQVGIEELAEEPMVVRERGSGTRAALEAALTEAGLGLDRFRIVAEMGSTQAVKQAVKAGVGVSVVSRLAVEEEVRAGTLASLRLKNVRITRGFHVVTRKDRTRSPLAEAFRVFLAVEAA